MPRSELSATRRGLGLREGRRAGAHAPTIKKSRIPVALMAGLS